MESSRKLALRTTLLFAGFSMVLICDTDPLLSLFSLTKEQMTTWFQLKGFFFIVIVSILLYLSINALARKQCNRCRAFIETVNDAIALFELETVRIIDVNSRTCEMFGYTPDEFYGGCNAPGITGERPFTEADVVAWLRKAAEGQPQHHEWRVRHKQGRFFWVDITLRRVSILNAERVLAVVRDITERKQTEEYLQRLNRTLKTLHKCKETLLRAENEPDLLDGICRIIHEDGRYRRVMAGIVEDRQAGTFRLAAQAGCQDGCGENLDTTWSELVLNREIWGATSFDPVPYGITRKRIPPRQDSVESDIEEDVFLTVLSVPLVHGSEVLGVLNVDATEPDEFNDEEINLMTQLAGDLAYGIKSLRDADERKRMEASLAKSKNNLAEAQSIAHLGSWEFDLGRDEEYRSDEFFRILGLPPRGNGRADDSVFTYIHPSDRERVRKCLTDTLEEGKPYDVEYRIIRPDATERSVHARGKTLQDSNGKITRFIGTILDVTERKKLEQKYLQAQKMEAIGQLAGGIAHDFNNILTAIFGYQHLLLERLDDGKSRHFAGQVTTLAEKAANLTGNLLAFSRKQPANPKPIDLNETVTNIGKILKRLIGEDIEFCFTPNEGLLPVMAVASQVEQVLMNLATNARDAMPNVGVLTVSTEQAEIDGNYVWAHGNGAQGKYAIISVSDTGTGMDDESQKRIFEPFFTTKEVGKGTGLGLSTAYGIVRQHGGFINVYSEPGEGTTFRIYLPLLETDVKEEYHQSDVVPAKGSETVLLAEDDPNIRDVICSLLEGNGYRVITAVDGDHALEQYIAHEADIDILILDIIMPKMNGKEVYDIISRAGQNVKTMFISGYSEDIIEHKGIPDICPLVTKPFSPHAFQLKLREVLDK